MTAGLGDGRFGPVYIGVDPDSDRVVVIRTFTQSMTDEQRQKLVTALQRLCDSPLDHPSIAQPLACGVDDGLAYLTHEYYPGESVDEFLQAHGPRPLAEIAGRVERLAAAIDAAAEAGLYHGALGPRDIIFGPESTGVSGFGLARALSEAGVEGNPPPSLADDVYAMGAMTFEMLLGYRYNGGDLRELLRELESDGVAMETLVEALGTALNPDPDWPPAASEFAAALKSAVVPVVAQKRRAAPAPDVGRLAFDPTDLAADAGQPPVERTRTQAPARPVTFPDDVERPELPLFDLSLHESPDRLHTPDADTIVRHVEPAPAFDVMRADARRDGSGSRGILVAVVLVLLAVVGAVAFYVSSGGLGSSGATEATGEATPDGDPTADAGAGGAAGGSAPDVINLDDPSATTSSGTAANGASGDAASPRGTTPEAPAGAASPRAEATPPPSRQSPPALPDVPAEPAPRTSRTAPPPVDPVTREDSATRGGTAPRESTAPREGTTSRDSARPSVPAPAQAAPLPPVADSAAQGPQGRVLVRSTPSGARVVINGEVRGETPVAIRGLELGGHTITVIAPGYPAWEQRIVLTPERPSQSFEIALDSGASAPVARPQTASLVPSTLQIDSRPSGAQVWMDGRLVGTTPFAVPRVVSGLHMVRLELDGFRPWTTSVAVGQGERVRVAASLER